MTKKQVRFGKGDRDKARMAVSTLRQIEELIKVTGKNKNEVVSDAITMYYMEQVHQETKRELAELRQAYDELYRHHCEVINQ